MIDFKNKRPIISSSLCIGQNCGLVVNQKVNDFEFETLYRVMLCNTFLNVTSLFGKYLDMDVDYI